jgi:hypothetical protein
LADANRFRHAAAGFLFLTLAGVGAWVGWLAAQRGVDQWMQPFGELARASALDLGALAGAGLGSALATALARLLTDFRAFLGGESPPERPERARALSAGLLTALLLVALGALVACSRGGQRWQELRPPGGGFRVLMPASPGEGELTEDTPHGRARGRQYLAYDRGAEGKAAFQSYAAAYLDYPEQLIQSTPPETIFQDQKESCVPSVGSVLGERPVPLKGFPGKELVLDKGDGRIVRFRFYLVRERLFILAAGYHQKGSSRPVDDFFGSFQLTGEE